jgi:hypothetical protein
MNLNGFGNKEGKYAVRLEDMEIRVHEKLQLNASTRSHTPESKCQCGQCKLRIPGIMDLNK